MEYPKNIYVASVDPMHYSHLNTLKLAEQQLDEKVFLVICQNELKTGNLFTLHERKEIARIYLPNEKIYIAKNYREVRLFLYNARRIVRGIRNQNDIEYMEKLGDFYSVKELKDKLYLVDVPKEYKDFSSTKLKRLVIGGGIREAEKMASREVVLKTRKKLKRYNQENEKPLAYFGLEK